MSTESLSEKMTCETCRAYLSDGIPPQMTGAVEAHLAVCPACRAEQDLLLLMREPAVSDEPPAAFTQSVLLQVKKARAARARLRSLRRVAGAVAAAVVLVPALMLLSPLLKNQVAERADTGVAAVPYTETTEEMPKLLFSAAAPQAAPAETETESAETAVLTETAAAAETERKADFSPPPDYVSAQRPEETATPVVTVYTMRVTSAAVPTESTAESAPHITGVVKDVTEKAILMENEQGEYWVSLPEGSASFGKGDRVTVWFDGTVAETYPMQIRTVYDVVLTTPSAAD